MVNNSTIINKTNYHVSSQITDTIRPRLWHWKSRSWFKQGQKYI